MIAVVLVVVGLVLLGVDAVDLLFCGLSIVAVLLMGLGLWVGGAFERATWFGDEATDAYCARVDQELDRAERVRVDAMREGQD